MDGGDRDWLAARFEERRPQLRAVAYRMLGSLSDADDAVQEAWVRLGRTDAASIENLGGWLTTVVSRVCLNMLERRRVRGEDGVAVHVPDPLVSPETDADPEQEALLADAVGLALQVVLDALAPSERLAYVLHDVFGVPFEEIAPIVGRSPVATRQLASRARRRVRTLAPSPDADTGRQRAVVDAFLAASRDGDLGALLALLDPDVVLRADSGPLPPPATQEVRGAEAVARLAAGFSAVARFTRPVRVNGAPGLLATDPQGAPRSILGFAVTGARIVQIDILADPERLARLDLALDGA